MRVKIGTFADMDKEEAFWTVLMISMIKDQFYKTVPQYEISYTGSMIRAKQIEATEHALVIQNTLPVMDLADIASIDDTEDFGCEHEYPRLDYIIDRYKDRVDNELLNLIDETEAFAIADKKYVYKGGFMGDEIFHPMKAFNLHTACGTAEELRQDQKWLARHNYAEQISRLAEQDYENNAHKIKEAIRRTITNRLRELCLAFVKGELANEAQKYTFDNWYYSYNSVAFPFGYDWRSNKADMKCAFSNAKPSVAIKIEPENIEQLAQICGCRVEDLPEQIRHWHKNDHRYTGNSLLDRLDPLTKVNDPFLKMNFSIAILLSKKEYLAICEEAGVENDEFWKNEKPNCFSDYGVDENICLGKRRYSYKNGGGYVYQSKCQKCQYWKQKKE